MSAPETPPSSHHLYTIRLEVDPVVMLRFNAVGIRTDQILAAALNTLCAAEPAIHHWAFAYAHHGTPVPAEDCEDCQHE